MLLLWLIITLMLLAALSFIAVPLLRQKPTATPTQTQLIQKLYQELLKAIDEQLAQQTLTVEQYQLEKTELLQQAAHDLDKPVAVINSASNKKLNIAAVIFFVIAMPIASIILYLQWGDSQQLNQYYTQLKNAKLVQKELAEYKNPQQLINRMLAILQQHPNSAKGWYLLGRLYLNQNQFDSAVKAFAKANQLQPNEPMIMQQYAESLFFANKNSLPAEAKQLLLAVLVKVPNDPDAINLLAIDAYNKQDYQTAINYWERLINDFDPTSPNGKALLQAIASAQKNLAKTNK